MNLKYAIQSEIRLTPEKMDKINEANLNIPKLPTPLTHIRSPVKPKEEITNPLIEYLSHQDNNQVLMKEASQLEEWPTFTGEGEYEHVSFIETIDMLQEDYAIPDELIMAILLSLFEKSARRWYCGIRQTNDKDEPLNWFLKKSEILNALYPNMSRNVVHMKILKKCGGGLEHALRRWCIEPCSTEEYMNALTDKVTRTKICRTWEKVDIKTPNKPFIKKD
ncbi:hypothetical protein O181_043702 [Austropuccinia psidii MF-1]|uniref:Uncharacterized protein n=1 Tax=Austropuccinia psidii MF-1 TaxID=1389203 RepID=A0A9Q3DQC6_9BASI|nr:hypothetical protein [Austropuccinia psidii MF-1]